MFQTSQNGFWDFYFQPYLYTLPLFTPHHESSTPDRLISNCAVNVLLTLFYLLDVLPLFPLSFPYDGVCACWSLYLMKMPLFSDLCQHLL